MSHLLTENDSEYLLIHSINETLKKNIASTEILQNFENWKEDFDIQSNEISLIVNSNTGNQKTKEHYLELIEVNLILETSKNTVENIDKEFFNEDLRFITLMTYYEIPNEERYKRIKVRNPLLLYNFKKEGKNTQETSKYTKEQVSKYEKLLTNLVNDYYGL